MTKVGLGDLQLYAPAPRIDLKQVVATRVEHNTRLERHLERACRTTGQRAIRFPEPWEDSATLAASAAAALLADQRVARSIRYLAVGTETGLDHSKPVSAYVQGMLRAAGIVLPEEISSFQVQHACAGATLSLVSVSSLLGLALPDERGVVIASDIARYQTESTAEITQGAGAAALLVERDPRLIELDLASLGLCSRDVDDFFRPIGASTARVKGQYSIQNYLESLEVAFLDHCRRRGEAPDQVLRETDMFVLHAPFRNMPMMAMLRLLERHLGLGEVQGEAFLDERGFHAAIDPIADIGNTYSAAMYFALGYLLADRHAALGGKIAGRSVLMASYGSGSTMAVFSGRLSERAPETIGRWHLERFPGAGRPAPIEEYEAWVSGFRGAEEAQPRFVPQGAFYLAGVRRDGYRSYGYAATRVAAPPLEVLASAR
jgi:hydroxymethylglutaryl-CoA synthase